MIVNIIEMLIEAIIRKSSGRAIPIKWRSKQKSEELFNVIKELSEARRGPESPKDRRGLEAKGR